MFELRTYTLASEDALQQYADVHWARHLESLPQFGIRTHRVWREVGGDQPRLLTLVEYEPGADPVTVGAAYMSSEQFRADMSGFDPAGIRGVESVFLTPASSDPVQ